VGIVLVDNFQERGDTATEALISEADSISVLTGEEVFLADPVGGFTPVPAMKEDPHLLNEAETAKINASIEKLQAATAGDNRRLINLAMDDLGFETQEFAHRRMNQSVNRALSGRKIDELKLGEEA